MKKILLLLVLLGNLTANSQTKTDNIPFILTESGHIIIQAKIDGVEGKFIFDTGAGHNLLFKKFTEKLKSKKSTNFFVAHRATGEALTVPINYSEDLTVGNRHFKNQLYSTFDLDFGDIDGLISLQPFQNMPVTIDYEKKILSFDELNPVDKKKYIDIQIANYADKALDIFTNIKLNDKINIQVLLDAGAGKNSFWVNARFMETLQLDSSQFEVHDKKSEFDSTKSNKFLIGTIQSIKTENDLAEVINPKTYFVEGLIYEGKTGIEWLGKKISISLPEKKIFIIK